MHYKFKTKPYGHQLIALEKSWQKKVYALFMEMGTGKTKVTLDNLAMLYDKGKVNGALIVAPKGVYKTWYSQEIPTHMPTHIRYKLVLWQATINQKQKKRLDTLFKNGCRSSCSYYECRSFQHHQRCGICSKVSKLSRDVYGSG